MVLYGLLDSRFPDLAKPKVLPRAAFAVSAGDAANKLGVKAKGVDFSDFKSNFGPDDHGFGYIKITVSKRQKDFSYL